MSHLHCNEEWDYSEENTRKVKFFALPFSTIERD